MFPPFLWILKSHLFLWAGEGCGEGEQRKDISPCSGFCPALLCSEHPAQLFMVDLLVPILPNQLKDQEARSCTSLPRLSDRQSPTSMVYYPCGRSAWELGHSGWDSKPPPSSCLWRGLPCLSRLWGLSCSRAPPPVPPLQGLHSAWSPTPADFSQPSLCVSSTVAIFIFLSY